MRRFLGMTAVLVVLAAAGCSHQSKAVDPGVEACQAGQVHAGRFDDGLLLDLGTKFSQSSSVTLKQDGTHWVAEMMTDRTSFASMAATALLAKDCDAVT